MMDFREGRVSKAMALVAWRTVSNDSRESAVEGQGLYARTVTLCNLNNLTERRSVGGLNPPGRGGFGDVNPTHGRAHNISESRSAQHANPKCISKVVSRNTPTAKKTMKV